MSNPSPSGSLLSTDASLGPTFLRWALGVMIFPHGAQLLFGWFGGPGFSAAIGMFTGAMHIPWILACLAILTECFGGALLILGLWTRVVAALVGVVMVVAALRVHLANGFFMNWSGGQKGEGYEFHILAVGIALALIILGGGRCSLDRLLGRQSEPPPAS